MAKRTAKKARKAKPTASLPRSPLSRPSVAAPANPRMYSLIRLLLIIGIIFFIGVFITSMLYFNYYMVDYIEINTSVRAMPELIAGFNTDNSSLAFGKVGIGGGAVKYFMVTSKSHVRASMVVDGNISSFITFSESDFYIDAGESKQIAARLELPDGTSPGQYVGKVRIYFFRK